MKVTTTYKSNAQGRGQIVATTTVNGKRRQTTVNYDQSRSSEANHGSAAGSLVMKVNPRVYKVDEIAKVVHTATDDGTRHTFVI